MEQIVRVVLVPPLGRLGALDYQVQSEHGDVVAGTRVLVPIGARRSMGVVIGTGQVAEPDRLRDVTAVLDERPLFDASLLALIEWMADYYLAPLAEAMTTALPGVLRVETDRVASAVPEGDDATLRSGAAKELLKVLRAEGSQTVRALQRRFGANASATVGRLRERGLVRVVERLRRESAPTRYLRFYEVAARLADDDPGWTRRPALLALYRYLREHPVRKVPAQELRSAFPNAEQKLRTLIASGLVRCRREEQYRNVLPPVAVRDRQVTLSDEQTTAVEALVAANGEGFVPALLLGVTGSGKTEVYLRIVAEVLKQQRTALILVPEISLTHQLVDRVRARFGDDVAVLHSQLTDGERWAASRVAKRRSSLGHDPQFSPRCAISGSSSSTKSTMQPTSRPTGFTTTAVTSRSCARNWRGVLFFSAPRLRRWKASTTRRPGATASSSYRSASSRDLCRRSRYSTCAALHRRRRFRHRSRRRSTPTSPRGDRPYCS
jgi:primosomal protein N' (replication factor Y)